MRARATTTSAVTLQGADRYAAAHALCYVKPRRENMHNVNISAFFSVDALQVTTERKKLQRSFIKKSVPEGTDCKDSANE